MEVKIGHAAISEKGTLEGTKGDSTGKEVCIRNWYSKPWNYMALHPDAIVREKHAKAVEASCANDNIGYGQVDRNSLNTLAKAVGYDLSKVGKCNCDCSSLQNVAAVAAGTPNATYGSNGWTTSTMRAHLQKLGYKIITDITYLKSSEYCLRGAIYVKEGSHTVTGLTNGDKASQTLVKAGLSNNANISNTGGIGYMFSVGLIKNGSKGKEVLLFQKITKATGDYTGLLDSDYGPKCVAACKAVQKRFGLSEDGQCGQKTWPQVLGL